MVAADTPAGAVEAPSQAPITMFGPDFPFAYDDWLHHPAGLGSVPADRHGTPVAVIGGGVAGVVVAYELMRLGLRPALYEAAGELGGRLRSVPFDGHPDALAEMGAMRFPRAATTLFHYIDKLGLRTRPFPNPLDAHTPSTLIDLEGERYWARTPADLPRVFSEVADAWDKTLQEGAELSTMAHAIRRRDVATVKAIWNRLVPELDDQSFYGFLAASPAFASFRHREIFGQIGFGTGGWDTDFPNSVLEILRVVYTEADDNQHLIVGGSAQLPRGIWAHQPATLAHWPSGTSLDSLHDGSPLPEVTGLRRTGDGIAVDDASGTSRTYAAAVFTGQHRLLLSKVRCDQSLLSRPCWTALERTHYMSSSKLFVLTDRPFWLDVDEETGHQTMGMTLTDRLPRGVYLFDDGPDQPGVICLSYTWNDDSQKVSALSCEERLEALLAALGDIYPDVDIRSHIIAPASMTTWENEPHFMGAFKQNLPGHYRYQRRLFTHFMQDGLAAEQRGLFLAGDDISWTGGFAEGAVTTALNAVWGVTRHLGGASHPDNPGPGDRYDELAPLSLPED